MKWATWANCWGSVSQLGFKLLVKLKTVFLFFFLHLEQNLEVLVLLHSPFQETPTLSTKNVSCVCNWVQFLTPHVWCKNKSLWRDIIIYHSVFLLLWLYHCKKMSHVSHSLLLGFVISFFFSFFNSNLSPNYCWHYFNSWCTHSAI